MLGGHEGQAKALFASYAQDIEKTSQAISKAWGAKSMLVCDMDFKRPVLERCEANDAACVSNTASHSFISSQVAWLCELEPPWLANKFSF